MKFFLMVDDCNVDKRLESSWHLVYYQVSGEPGIARCSRRSDIYLGECGLARKLIHWSLPRCNFIFRVFNFLGWSQPRNYLTAKFSRSTAYSIIILVLLKCPASILKGTHPKRKVWGKRWYLAYDIFSIERSCVCIHSRNDDIHIEEHSPHSDNDI